MYDKSCGWPLYRYQRRGKWCYAAGGVLTFGAAPPPMSLYERPVDSPVIKKTLAVVQSVSPVLGSGPREYMKEVRM